MDTSTVLTNYPRQRTARRVTKLTRPPRLPSTTTNAARSTSPTRSALRPPEPSSSIDPSSSTSRRHHHNAKPKPPDIEYHLTGRARLMPPRIISRDRGPWPTTKGARPRTTKGRLRAQRVHASFIGAGKQQNGGGTIEGNQFTTSSAAVQRVASTSRPTIASVKGCTEIYFMHPRSSDADPRTAMLVEQPGPNGYELHISL